MGTPICPNCHKYLYLCDCPSVDQNYVNDLVRQWEENGRLDDLFDEDSLALIHAAVYGGGGWQVQTDNDEVKVKVTGKTS